MMNFSLQYLNILKTRFNGLNLTRILDDQEFYEKQVLDSILPYEQCILFRRHLDETQKLVDIGFGGGFPLLPLTYHCPLIHSVGFESRSKKAEAVKIIAEELKIDRVKTFHRRSEEINFDIPVTVTFKAVGTVTDCLAKISCSDTGVRVFFYKGPSFQEKEFSEFEKNLSREWRLILNEQLRVPGTDERRIIGFAPIVPRGTPKNLVKLSQFF